MLHVKFFINDAFEFLSLECLLQEDQGWIRIRTAGSDIADI